MLKQGLKNYFVGMKNFFTPLGTIFLGILIGLSVLIADTTNILNNFCSEISATTGLEIAPDTLNKDIWFAVRELNWNKPFYAINTLFGKDWLKNVLINATDNTLGTEGISAQIEAVAYGQADIEGGLIGFFCFVALGFLSGFVLMKFLIRKNIADRTFFMAIIQTVINSILSAFLTVVMAYLFLLWHPSIAISVAITMIFTSFISLLEAYIVYGRKYEIKQILNIKNLSEYIVTNFLIFTISAVVTFSIIMICPLVGIFIGLSFFSLSVIVTDLNAQAFVQNGNHSVKTETTPSIQ